MSADAVMTEREWQDTYEITSAKGRIWTRAMVLKCTVEMLKVLVPDSTPIERRTAVQLLLDDSTFMRFRKGMVPAAVIKDAAMEAMLRLVRQRKETKT